VVFHDRRLASDRAARAATALHATSADAHLMLALKWSRPKLVQQLLAEFQESTDTDKRRAARAFRVRTKQATLPRPLDPNHRIAEFVEGSPARYRFPP
jgi:hypothetical protein